MRKLDRTEQRLVGVLIEKQLSVPDSYPLSENALLDGCNQKTNRDPVTELVAFQVAGTLMSLQEKGCVARIEGGGRVAKFKHRVVEELHLDPKELAILAELLLRGAQAPGALKPRVARMGCHASPEEVEAMLQKLAQQSPPLVVKLPVAPRERDHRWRHLLGDGSELPEVPFVMPGAPVAGAPVAAAAPLAATRPSDLEGRVSALESRVAEQKQEITELRDMIERRLPKQGS